MGSCAFMRAYISGGQVGCRARLSPRAARSELGPRSDTLARAVRSATRFHRLIRAQPLLYARRHLPAGDHGSRPSHASHPGSHKII